MVVALAQDAPTPTSARYQVGALSFRRLDELSRVRARTDGRHASGRARAVLRGTQRGVGRLARSGSQSLVAVMSSNADAATDCGRGLRTTPSIETSPCRSVRPE